MLPFPWQTKYLVDRVRWLKRVLPPSIAVIVVVYQLMVTRFLADQYGHLVHYSVEIAFYSLVGPIVTWITLAWVETSLIEKETLEKRVQSQAQQLASLTNASADAIISLDSTGNIMSWNLGAQHILGFAPNEIIGQPLSNLMVETSRLENLLKATGQVQNFETRAISKSGRSIKAELTFSKLGESDSDDLPVSLMILRDITARREIEAILEEERARISRDLHDGVAQMLYFIALKADLAYEQLSAEKEELANEQKEIGKKVRQAIREVRRTIFALEPLNWAEDGFITTLQNFITRFAEQVELEIEYEIDREAEKIPSQLQPTIFRVVQESLNNIAKHSSASRVVINLEYKESDAEVALEIRDYGVGFVLEENSAHGYGIMQMRQRVEAIGGKFKISSQKKQGSTVSVQLPLL